MRFSSKPLSQTVTQLCLAKEIDQIVISPGSRNAPLTIGFTQHSGFKCYSIVDERCAAFFALGLAQQIKRPVALVCTSGSALLNYYPAIAEAYYSDIPLVVLSADRPSELIDIGDGQTIRQENVFENHILYSANCNEGAEEQLNNEKEINVALNLAIELKGPVHINLPFSEPLYDVVDDLSVRPQNVSARGSISSSDTDYYELREIWKNSSRKMLLLGVMDPGAVPDSVWETIAEDPDVVVFTETTSNAHHESHFPAIDQIIYSLNRKEFEALQPELLITMGGMVVSKKIKAFLRSYRPRHHWHIDEKKAFDTYFSLSEHIKIQPAIFLKEYFNGVEKKESNYFSYWNGIRQHRLEKHKEYERNIPYSDFMVYGEVLRGIPHNSQLQLANSAAVRYAQLFDLHQSLEVYCNRGASGIDGSTSTAVGAAVGSEKPTVLVSGDLSFFYDSNALWNNYIPKDFRIVLVNNSGGGIFRILPGAKETAHFENYFETSHQLEAKQLAEMYGFSYESAQNKEELQNVLESFYKDKGKPAILEVFTPAELNDGVLLNYFEFTR